MLSKDHGRQDIGDRMLVDHMTRPGPVLGQSTFFFNQANSLTNLIMMENFSHNHD